MAEAKKPKLSAEDVESRADNLPRLAARYGTIDKFPDALVIARASEVIVLRDGMKVTNHLLEERLADAMKDQDFADEVAEIRNQSAKKEDKGAPPKKEDKGAPPQK